MGSSNSKEKELNEDLERIRKERIAKERAERDRAERERAERERAERERAERDRVANLKLILVKVTSPPPGCEIEIDEAATVRVFLEEVAPLFGLNKSAAPSLQAEFSETILEHKLELKGAGMCDESLCSVLGVEAALASAAKAKNMDIVKAANEDRIADVKFVLQHAPEKVNDQDEYEETALHRAAERSAHARHDSFEVAKVLVAANANVDISDKYGRTALFRAAYRHSPELAEVLVAANANVDVKDEAGYTALHLAAQADSLEVAEVLVAANASVDIKDNSGFNALHYAKDRNHQAMITLLSLTVAFKDSDGDLMEFKVTSGEILQLYLNGKIIHPSWEKLQWLQYDEATRTLTDPSSFSSPMPSDVNVAHLKSLADRCHCEWRGDVPTAQ